MARYSLKTFHNEKQIEFFEHKPKHKIIEILMHPKHDMADEVGDWGEELNNPNRFEIYGSFNVKIFNGNIHDAISFAHTLKK